MNGISSHFIDREIDLDVNDVSGRIQKKPQSLQPTSFLYLYISSASD